MKAQFLKSLFLGAVALCGTMATFAADDLSVKYLGNGQSLVRPKEAQKYLLLPIEERQAKQD